MADNRANGAVATSPIVNESAPLPESIVTTPKPMSPEDYQAQLDALRAERDALIAQNETMKASARSRIYLKVSEKGAVSLYGLGRFPATFYVEQWDTVLNMSDTIRAFMVEHKAELKLKADVAR